MKRRMKYLNFIPGSLTITITQAYKCVCVCVKGQGGICHDKNWRDWLGLNSKPLDIVAFCLT